MLQKIKDALLEKWRCRKGLAVLYFGFMMIIGVMMPLMALSWDVNQMRLYKQDMENVAQMGMLACIPHAENEFDERECLQNAVDTIACNIDPADRQGLVVEGGLPAPSRICAVYKSAAMTHEVVGVKEKADESHYFKPERRPGLKVTKISNESTEKRIKLRITAEYEPLFIGVLTGEGNKPITLVDKSPYFVSASIVVPDSIPRGSGGGDGKLPGGTCRDGSVPKDGKCP